MFQVGDVIEDQYAVERVASGGMGVVLMVRDVFSGSLLAAKTVKDEALDSVPVRERFRREARTWMNLDRHENLVSALFYREIAGRPFLFLEYVDGEDLQTLLMRDAPMPLLQVLDWGLQLCRGMARAHRTEIAAGHPGLVHRDLKPSNLFVTRERVLKVSDFGMAKVYDRALEMTAEGIGMGTPHYMPPEQLRDAHSADARADVYAAGMVLYQLATGMLPLRAERIENQVYNILNLEPPPASARNPAVPPELDAVLARCLSKRREDRFESFTDLTGPLAAIMRALGEFPADAGATCPVCELPTRARPGRCPLCGSDTEDPRAFRAVAPLTIIARAAPESPAAPRLVDVSVRPRAARTGREITLTARIVNPGGIARDASLTLPAADGFERIDDALGWTGTIPPCDIEKPLRVDLRLMPVREGRFDLPPLELSWRGPSGRRRHAPRRSGPRIRVEFSYRIPLVGREKDLAALTSRLREVREGEAAALLLTGEVGVGRSRVLTEMAAEADRAGFLVLRGKAVQRGVQPFKALHDGLIVHCGLAGRPQRQDEALTAVIEHLGPHLGNDPDLVRYLAGFLAGLPPTSQDTPERVNQRWARLYTALAADRPLALVLDDLHWSEGETLDVIVNTLRRARETRAPLLVLASWLKVDPDAGATERIGQLEATARVLRREGVPVDFRELGNLDPDEIERFTEAVFPRNRFEADHPWFPQALAEVTDGQPFFLLEILRSLRSGDGDLPRVLRTEGGFRLDPDLDEERFRQYVPDAVEDVLGRRLRALPEPVRAVAEMAALLGEEFEAALLVEVAGDAEGVDRALEDLERADLVRPVDETLRRYRFPNGLTVSTLVRGVSARSPRGTRRRHRAIVAAMRRLYGEQSLRRRRLRLGRHLLAAGEGAEGFRMLVAGARDLVSRQAYPRAWSALNRAGEVLGDGETEIDDEDRIRHLMLRGEVARVLGRYDEGLRCFRSVVEEPSEGVGRDVLGLAYSHMGLIHELRGEYDDALFCYCVGKDMRAEVGNETGLRHSLNNVGRIHQRRGETGKAREVFEEARDRAERAGDRPVLAEAYLNLGTLDLDAGRIEDARVALRKGLRLARRIRDRRLVAQGLNGLGNAAYVRGRPDRALKYHRRALALRRTLGDREGLSNSYNNLGAIEDQRGRDEEALGYYERSAEIHRDLGSRHGLAVVLGNIARVRLRRGEVARAREIVEEAVRIRGALGDPARLGVSRTILGDVLAEAGEGERARAEWTMAHRLLEDGGRPSELAEVNLRLARASCEDGDLDRATTWLERARRRWGEEAPPESGLEIQLMQAEIAMARGDVEAARAAAERAAETSRRGLSVGDRARARRLRARTRLLAGEVRSGLAMLRRVVRDLEAREAPIPAIAAALMDLGRALVEHGGAARRVLTRAARLYEDLAREGRHDRERVEVRELLDD